MTIDTIWRVEGYSLDIDQFLRTYRLDDAINGQSLTDFGFSYSISTASDPRENTREVSAFLEEHRSAFLHLTRNNISSSIDFGCFVGNEDWMKSLHLERNFLSLIGELGVELEFSAYATNDEKEGN